MQIANWYTFEDDEHSYGYTLFYPLRINSPKYGSPSYYGMYLLCNDSGPNNASKPGAWQNAGFGSLENALEDAAVEYHDIRGGQPPVQTHMIEQIFVFMTCDFVSRMSLEDDWIR